MNALNLARAAYGRPETPIRSARRIEYDLFARVTRDLSSAAERKESDFPALAAAIYENTRLWRTLAIDLASDGNGLPQTLRAQLFGLFQFSAEHGRKVLADKADVAVLIDINTAVMRGLRAEGDKA